MTLDSSIEHPWDITDDLSPCFRQLSNAKYNNSVHTCVGLFHFCEYQLRFLCEFLVSGMLVGVKKSAHFAISIVDFIFGSLKYNYIHAY